MKNLFTSIFIITVLLLPKANAQVLIDTISYVSKEGINTQFCFNNTKLMTGNNTADRYLVYYNADTIFLNVQQSGNWIKKIAHTGSNIKSATITQYLDTIWLCWKEGPFIKSRYTPDKGTSWSSILPVSPAGNVAAPSIYASSNGKIHFVWHSFSPTDTTIYHRMLFHGVFATTPYQLSNSTGQGQWPSVIAIGDTVLCAWKEEPLPSKVWFRSSYDGGLTWNPLPAQPTTTLLPLSKDPNLAYAYDSTTNTHYLYLAYDGLNKIYLQRSTNFGNTWTNPDTISNLGKWSQFAHIECNDRGFVGIAYEQRPIGASLFDDTKKDVGFTYSTNWGNSGSFSIDTLAYTHNGFGSAYPGFSKIDENNFYLAWLTKNTINNKMHVLERRIHLSSTTGISFVQNINLNISVFPNPFSILTTLQSDTPFNNATITVFNTFGQVVLKIKNITGQTVILKRDNLAPGLYFARLTQDNKVIAIEKIIIAD